MMQIEQYFPLGLASGAAFCNREAERAQLAANIRSGKHTLIMSPRRYGKTSLVKYTVDEIKALYAEADLFIAVDPLRIEQQILAAIKRMLSQVTSSKEQVLEILRQYFKKLNAQWTIGTQGVNVTLVPEKDTDVAINVMEALGALEDVLSKKKVTGVMFIDEMQEIGEVAEGAGIEGAIRHIAQKSKYLVFVFSGSRRHLLSQMFYNKARPLYKLCDRIQLSHISEQAYEKHLLKLSQKRWGEKISTAAMQVLFQLTARHSYYMNALCAKLWSEGRSLPTEKQILTTWNDMVVEERQEISRELSTLSQGQRKLLIAIAHGQDTLLTGRAHLAAINMSSAAVIEALKQLQTRDYIEKQPNNHYTLIDPLMATALRLYFEI